MQNRKRDTDVQNSSEYSKAETSIFWPPDAKSWLIGKNPGVGEDWEQEEKGATEDEIVGWHHRLSGHEFEQIPGIVKVREAWHVALHGVTKSWTWLSDWTTTFVISFFPRNNCLLISWLQSPSAVILEPKKIKSVLLYSPHITPYILPHSSIQFIFKFETISRDGHWSFSNLQEGSYFCSSGINTPMNGGGEVTINKITSDAK